MKFAFFGDFVEEHKRMIEGVGIERGHTHGGPADVIFMMAYERNIPSVGRAAEFGNNKKPVLVLRAGQPRWEEERAFFLTRKVKDIVDIPYTEEQAHELFVALEIGDTSSLA